MTAMAAPVRAAAAAIGVITIAGPLVRLTEERMLALGERCWLAAEVAAPAALGAVPPRA